MPVYDVGGVSVEFPYEAYDCQLAYMASVIRSLEDGTNALLESPTGTGKTLCLLCAALAWRRQRERLATVARTSWEAQAAEGAAMLTEGTPKIWFASRTHSQLKQVIRELKRTSYRPHSIVLGSRERFCVHSSVSRESGAKQNAMCRRMRDDNRCSFYTALKRGKGNGIVTSCLDIEEIVTACKDGGVCPFYKSREDAKDAEILLIPYDYLINPQTRAALSISLKGNILIFDEAHNIEKSCEGIASFDLTSKELAGAIDELDEAFELLNNDPASCESVLNDMTSEQLMAHLNILKKNLLALEQAIGAEHLKPDAEAGRTLLRAPGSRIQQLLGKCGPNGVGFTGKDVKRVGEITRATVAILTFSSDSTSSGGTNLDKIQSLLNSSFNVDPQELDRKYQMLIFEDGDATSRAPKRKAVGFFPGATRHGVGSRTLSLWCFSSSVAMRELEQQGVRCILLTSGTLTPLDSAADTFGISFPVLLENKHVIDIHKQLWGGVLSHGPAQAALNASFAQRGDPAYHRDLGHTVATFAKHVPDGILVAFQSYGQKEDILRGWRQMGVWDEIVRHKQVFVEPQRASEVPTLMEKYNATLQARGGAILCAVSRGKLCEGIDFSDRQCRMVLMIGIPYPAKNDLRVLMKQAFLDDIGSAGDGKRWYARETVRAMNQTVGRVIRHKDDFGAVLLCDVRYASGNRLSSIAMGLSSWLRPRVMVTESFDSALASCRHFFGGCWLARASAAPTIPEESNVAAAKTGATTAAAAAGSDSGAGGGKTKGAGAGISLSALGALLRRKASGEAPTEPREKKRASVAADANQAAPTKCPDGTRRPPPTPLVAAAAAPGATALGGACVAAAVAGAPSGRTAAWLAEVQALLPRAAYDALRANALAMFRDAEVVCDNAAGAGAGLAETRMLQAMRHVAEGLIPVFNFDTPADRSQRDALVRRCGELLPRLLLPLWKRTVQELLRRRGLRCDLWVTAAAGSA